MLRTPYRSFPYRVERIAPLLRYTPQRGLLWPGTQGGYRRLSCPQKVSHYTPCIATIVAHGVTNRGLVCTTLSRPTFSEDLHNNHILGVVKWRHQNQNRTANVGPFQRNTISHIFFVKGKRFSKLPDHPFSHIFFVCEGEMFL